jgi:hypothetical protein
MDCYFERGFVIKDKGGDGMKWDLARGGALVGDQVVAFVSVYA